MKYIKQIFLSIMSFILLITSVIASASKIPLVLIVLLFPIMGIIGILFGYILAPLLLLIYKKIIGRNLLFGIQDSPTPKKFTGVFKGIFPALMSTSISLSLIFRPEFMSNPLLSDFYKETNGIILLFFILCTFSISITTALFSAAWFIIDSGIITANKKKAINRGIPIEVKSAGGWYLTFLKGYAGIGALIGLYTFFGQIVQNYGSKIHFSIPLIFIPLPILLSLWILPAFILLDKTFESRKNFILRFGKTIGIKNEIEVKIEKLEI